MTPDFNQTVEFLAELYPEGPWLLTAISVDKKTIRSGVFGPDDQIDLFDWLRRYDKFNLYYSVNVPVEQARGKTTKLSKHEVDAVYVPPRPTPILAPVRTSAEEQERILETLLSYKIEPTHVDLLRWRLQWSVATQGTRPRWRGVRSTRSKR